MLRIGLRIRFPATRSAELERHHVREGEPAVRKWRRRACRRIDQEHRGWTPGSGPQKRASPGRTSGIRALGPYFAGPICLPAASTSQSARSATGWDAGAPEPVGPPETA